MEPEMTFPPTPISATRKPLLSILNVVVDHVMMPPSPMEPIEFREVYSCDHAGRNAIEKVDSSVISAEWENYVQFPKEIGLQVEPLSASTDEKNFGNKVALTNEAIDFSSGHNNNITINNKSSSNFFQAAQNVSLDKSTDKNVRIRVPVLRVFGPVLRDGNDALYRKSPGPETRDIDFCLDSQETGSKQFKDEVHIAQQPQSGCLHIHGAYPYMLARPVIAGPSGSMYHGYYYDQKTSTPEPSSCNDTENIVNVRTTGRNIDWDDADSVSNILQEVKCRLEMALLMSLEQHAEDTFTSKEIDTSTNDEKKTTTPKKIKRSTCLNVRQVTVVMGRGFYTFCAGPPAPFLRVEYYDPSLRWRVKMILERGLELDQVYHPDPRQYNYTNSVDERNGGAEAKDQKDDHTSPLKFRCYEAHIPYTMQVFKDYNLAGMRYIKVANARFRNPLPRTLRKRTKDDFSRNLDSCNNVQFNNQNAFFFDHTIAKDLRWPRFEDVRPHPISLTSFQQMQYNWLRKQSCCDLEFDTTVEKLQNIHDVMTELPSPLEDRQKIHWRAVPSLREIWEQEKKRMSILLPPENDFLSFPKEENGMNMEEDDKNSDGHISDNSSNQLVENVSTTPPFTLNVKRGESFPGTKLAVKGLKQLFHTSEGLESDFQRAMRDIVLRHQEFIDKVDQKIMNGDLNVNNSGRVLNQNKTSLSQRHEFLSVDYLTPCLDEGVEALAALGDQFSQNSVAVEENMFNETQLSDYNFSSCNSDMIISQNTSLLKRYEKTPLSQIELDEEKEMLTFGDLVDNEQFIEHHKISNGSRNSHSFMIDYYGDDSMVQNDDNFLDEEERLGEEGLERTLSILGTQASEANNISSESVRYEKDSYVDVNHYHTQFLDEENESCTSSNEDTHDCNIDRNIKPNIETIATKRSSTNENSFGVVKVDGFESQQSLTCKDVNSTENLSHHTRTFVLKPKHSLQRGEIVKQALQSHSAMWFPLPRVALDSCLPWFKFKWEFSGATPTLKIGAFVEPVKRPPSFSQVKSLVLAPKKLPTNANQHLQPQNLDFPKAMKMKEKCFPDKHQTGVIVKYNNNNATESNNFRDNNIPHYAHEFSSGTKEGERTMERSCSQNYFTQYSQRDEMHHDKKGEYPLLVLEQQGCHEHVTNCGGLKTSFDTPSTFTPITVMSLEVHVQCRIKVGLKDHREIAMVPDSSRDAVFAVVYVYCYDPGGGEKIKVLEKGCVLVPIQKKNTHTSSLPLTASNAIMGISSSILTETVDSEESLLLRVASIVQLKDPDVLMSWDTQGSGIGYLVERGLALGRLVDCAVETSTSSSQQKIDMARLLGRTPKETASEASFNERIEVHFKIDDHDEIEHSLTGSGLGSEWDDRVGAGAAAASIVGRIVVCVWKVCYEECKHPNAPAIVSTVLKKRIPFHDDLMLTRWYSGENGEQMWRVIEYKLAQAISNVFLIDELDILGRAGEAAQLSGVEFSQSLPGIRGSQYKVEGVLLRALQSVQSNEKGEKKGYNNLRGEGWEGASLTSSSFSESVSQSQSPWKRRRLGKMGSQKCITSDNEDGYFFFSPSKADCSNQEALECQALTLEPKSGFHFDPVVVCDFTALYPSLVIAYNLCYSTLAGKLDYHSTRKEMRCSGQTTMKIGPFHYPECQTATVIKHHIRSLNNEPSITSRHMQRDRAYVVPTGSIFVSESVLKGVLPQVLDEMLSTRAMLKKAAKEYKKRVPNLSPAVLRQIEARQLALKYVANVTYGYTSATFSGRCASPLVADTIVDFGRRTLSNAIDIANSWGKESNGKWYGAHVVYGDTDSIFIKLPGKSVKEAFTFGEEYCRVVTASNPPPIQLKLEKVYAVSLLQTKKKYCGMMCESTSQKPVFEAKGIETVRRDQCSLTQKILRNVLIKVFEKGISSAKDYLAAQWALIHAGRVPVSDFILTGRVRSHYRGSAIGPVQAALARRLAEVDPGRVVRHKERLAYVIVASPGRSFKLRDCVLTPIELLERWGSFTIHTAYYITKHVNAALQRCLALAPFNLDVHNWYSTCPKPRKKIHFWPFSGVGSSSMISNFFGSDVCSLCDKKCKSTGSLRVAVCPNCKVDNISVVCTAIERLNKLQQKAHAIAAACSTCNGCLETAGTFAAEEPLLTAGKINSQRRYRLCNPMANCVCIDCPMTYKRHELRQSEIEASELIKAVLS